jgi:hypothetical protein
MRIMTLSVVNVSFEIQLRGTSCDCLFPAQKGSIEELRIMTVVISSTTRVLPDLSCEALSVREILSRSGPFVRPDFVSIGSRNRAATRTAIGPARTATFTLDFAVAINRMTAMASTKSRNAVISAPGTIRIFVRLAHGSMRPWTPASRLLLIDVRPRGSLRTASVINRGQCIAIRKASTIKNYLAARSLSRPFPALSLISYPPMPLAMNSAP